MENVHQFPPLIDRITQREDLCDGKKVKKKRLINKLNAINFKGGTLLVNLRHIKYNHTIIRIAMPLPCLGDELVCAWAETAGNEHDSGSYQLLDILVPDGPKVILVKSESASINNEGVRMLLPDTSRSIGLRKVKRHPCIDVKAQLIQNSACFTGELLEFSPMSFNVEIDTSPLQTFQWINPELPLNVMFFDECQTFYTGSCRIINQIDGRTTKSFILEPTENEIRRFKPKEFRSTRQQLVPLPNMIFRHPMTQKLENLKVFDISGSGFAVEENRDHSVLLPGMIITEAKLDFAGSFTITCKAQVVYRKKNEEAKEKDHLLRCGLALLDMDIEEHRKLLSLLHQAADRRSYLSGFIDMDALWDFFFESGFIYPQKYNFFKENRDNIKETYQRLYTSNPTIARHFTYQDKGRIMGHMAMLRFYNKSWLIQHHAASVSASPRAGLSVLNQIGRFINDSHRLCSANMNFVFCYFRPENKFPERIFGGVSRGINDPKGCSVDTFAYFHYRNTENHGFEEGDGWTLTRTEPGDLKELAHYYEFTSGGLMLAGLELEANLVDMGELSEEYRKLGFKRERVLYSLKKGSSLKAVIMVNISDIGLNLSDLTRCIQVFVIDSDQLPRDIFYRVLSELSSNFGTEEIPVLVYPVSYAENQSILFEKRYNLWVLNMKNTDDYFRQLKKIFSNIQC
ncbi:MAG: hypothetical protein P1P89_06085 [Desulfobacterales bacterium]|nr:hypothetical protein [Desulfobacterales bacterium]